MKKSIQYARRYLDYNKTYRSIKEQSSTRKKTTIEIILNFLKIGINIESRGIFRKREVLEKETIRIELTFTTSSFNSKIRRSS